MQLTLGDKLALSKGRPTGFDYMRISLSVCVICLHSVLTTRGWAADTAFWHSPLRGLFRMILPMFFALSGFLVAGSLLRTSTLIQFLGLRALRIYPALVVEVFLSALVLGPILTTVPLGQYFSSHQFGIYLLNATGHIHYLLPGVFRTNPYPGIVNAQLWTVPYELMSYLTLGALAVFGIKKRSWLAPAATVALMGLFLAVSVLKHKAGTHDFGTTPGPILIICFLAGLSVFLYKDRLPWSHALIVASGIASVALAGFVPCGIYVAAPFAAYFTVSLGLYNPAKPPVLRRADYSYGIYVYGFVIQQTLAATCPWSNVWWINIALSVPLAAAFAALSWHWVEEPALKLRRYLQPETKRPALVPWVVGKEG